MRLGIDVFCEEAGHDGDDFGGGTRERVVPRAVEDPERSAPRLVEAVSVWGWGCEAGCGAGFA